MAFNLIGYFIAIVIVAYVYAVFLTFIAKTLLFVFKEMKQWTLQKLKRIQENKVRDTFVLEEYLQLIKNPFFLQSKKTRFYLVLFVLGNILAWQYFRYKDVINSDFKHKEAREYYALGNLLLVYDMGLVTLFRDPDSLFLKPINTLQDSMIQRAQENLPKNDGEIAIYHYFFKLYPYMQTHYDPTLGDAKKVQALTYKVLKEFSTLSIEDKEVREYARYRMYPMAAEYFIYIQWNGYKNYPKRHGHRKYMERMLIEFYKDSYKIQQLEDIGRWSLTHYKTLQTYPRMKRFIKENPLIDAMYLSDITLPFHAVLESKMFLLTFRCTDELVPLTYKYTKMFYDRYYALTDKRYWGYDNAIITQAQPLLDALHSLCGYELIGKEKLLNNGWPVRKFLFQGQGYLQRLEDHLEWRYRVAELEKVILKTNFREQALECSKYEWHSPKYSSIRTSYNYEKYKDNPVYLEILRKEAQENLHKKLQELENIKQEYTQCLIDKGLIQPDKEKYLQCYSKEWMWHKKFTSDFSKQPLQNQIQFVKQIEIKYEKCLIDNNLIKLHPKITPQCMNLHFCIYDKMQ